MFRLFSFFLLLLFCSTLSARKITLENFIYPNYTKTCDKYPTFRGRPNSTYEFAIIHVGKTGGTSLVAALKDIFSFGRDYHLCAPSKKDLAGLPVMLTIREPVARSQSIWRWRKFRCPNHDRCLHTPEYNLFQCFPYLEDFIGIRYGLIENKTLPAHCYRTAIFPRIPLKQWQLDHQWHIHKLTQDYVEENVFPVRQSNLVDDFVAFCQYNKFDPERCAKGKLALQNVHLNEEYPTTRKDYFLSDKATKCLQEELEKEIEKYDELVELVESKTRSLKYRKK